MPNHIMIWQQSDPQLIVPPFFANPKERLLIGPAKEMRLLAGHTTPARESAIFLRRFV